MPDISMCNNIKCKRRLTCYRFTAKPNPYMQSYSAFQTREVDGVEVCDAHWNNANYTTERVTMSTGDTDGE